MTNSEFKVNVTADISALQASLKSVQADLDKFKTSADGAAVATKKMEAEANRGRLVAFAFGQVLRDAGFFAQDFRLGILAISNNIPILIDQLVLLSNVSKGVGSAISLLGSLLTAGLTIWAYSASSVDKVANSLKEYKKSLNDSRASAETEIVTLKKLISIAGDQSNSLTQRQDAVNQLNNKYDQYNNALNVNNVNSEKNIGITDRLTQSILLQAKATAEAANYTKLQGQLYEAQDTKLEDQVSFFEKFQIYTKGFIENSPKFAAAMGSLSPVALSAAWADFNTVTERAIGIKGMENFADAFNKLSPEIDASKKRLESLIEEIAKLGGTGGKGGKSVLQELSEKLKAINSDITLDGAEVAQQRANAYKTAIQGLIEQGVEPASEAIQRLQNLMVSEFGAAGAKQFVESLDVLKAIKDAQDKIGLRAKGTPQAEFRKGAVRPVDITGDYQRQFTDLQLMMFDMIPTIGEMTGNIVTQVANGFGDIIQSFADGLGQLLTGKMGIKDFGQSIIQSISGFLSQLGRQMIAFGAATVAFGLAQKVLQEDGDPASKIKAGFGLIAAGAALSAAGGAIRNAAGGSSSSTSASPTPTFGSLTPRPATSPTSTSAMAINGLAGGGTLETRVSGNDLVILLDRASNNRNKYF